MCVRVYVCSTESRTGFTDLQLQKGTTCDTSPSDMLGGSVKMSWWCNMCKKKNFVYLLFRLIWHVKETRWFVSTGQDWWLCSSSLPGMVYKGERADCITHWTWLTNNMHWLTGLQLSKLTLHLCHHERSWARDIKLLCTLSIWHAENENNFFVISYRKHI